MLSSLKSLQDAITDKLRTSSKLSKFRIIKEECLNTNESFTTGNTSTIVVKIPFPISASSGFSNFNFKEIAIPIEINSPRLSAGNISSPLSIAEYISKQLHSWQATTSYGQSTLCINPQSPWKEYIVDTQNFSITLNFVSQSIA